MVDRYAKFATEHLANAASCIDVSASEDNVINLSRSPNEKRVSKS
jgi:hypothetical protein